MGEGKSYSGERNEYRQGTWVRVSRESESVKVS